MKLSYPFSLILEKNNQFYIKIWFKLCVIALIFYLPYIFTFIWGNHDWGWIKEYTPLFSGIFEGRFSQFILQTILFEGNILPIFTLFTSILFYSATSILTLSLWKIPKKEIIYILLGLSLITAPYTISWLYFKFILLSCLSWTFFTIFSFYILNNKYVTKGNYLCATILFSLILGGYPPIINLICLIFFTLLINNLCFDNFTINNLIKKYTPIALSILSSVILVLFIQFLLKKYNLQYETYNTSSIKISDILSKLLLCFKASLTQFTTTTSFISPFYKNINLLFVITAFFVLLKNLKKTKLNFFIFIIAIIGLLMSSTISLLVSNNSIYILNQPRIEFYGLIYIYIFSIATILKSSNNLLKNIITFIICTILLYNLSTIAYANKIWNIGFDAETKLIQRLVDRIETNNNFKTKKQYTFIQGGNLDFRSKYYNEHNQYSDSYTLTAPYIPWHLPSKAIMFYQPTSFIEKDFDTYWSYVNYQEVTITQNLIDYIKDKAKPWPNKNSIYIDNKTIILTLTPDGKNLAKHWIDSYI